MKNSNEVKVTGDNIASYTKEIETIKARFPKVKEIQITDSNYNLSFLVSDGKNFIILDQDLNNLFFT